MGEPTSPESALREKLKVELQDARLLYTQKLIDLDELRDLKQHALRKYKKLVDALSISTASPAIPRLPPVMHTPPVQKRSASWLRDVAPEGGAENGSHSAPPCAKRRRQDVTLAVEPEIYQRLMTPQILRRRTPSKRKIILRSDDLAVLRNGDSAAS